MENKKKKVKRAAVCLGRFGDIYQCLKVCTNRNNLILITTPQFAPIVREMFPEVEIFLVEIPYNESKLAAQIYKDLRGVTPEIWQQNGMGFDVVREWNGYHAYQVGQATQKKP
jgi:hypothetical protein